MAAHARIERLAHVAWLPVPALLLVMVALWLSDWSAAHESPHWVVALNVLFALPVALLAAYQAGRAFLLRGDPESLWFGCGMLFWGSSGLAGVSLLPHGPEAAVTIHNVLVWLMAACHLAGALLARRQPAIDRKPELWLVASYAGALIAVVLLVHETIEGRMPVFFARGEGGTSVRQWVLGSAIAMLGATAFLIDRRRGETWMEFQRWYALALLLIAVGLFGVMIQSAVGSALGWVGRFAQSLASIYLLVAIAIGMRETRDRSRLLESALGEARQRFEELIQLAADGIAVHEMISETSRGYFLRVNPTLCALLGYTAEEMRALTPSDIVVPEDREKMAEEAEDMRRNGSLRHEKTLVAKDGRRIPVEISSRQYHHEGRAMAISVIRDIAQRKEAERQLFATNARLESLMETLPVGVSFSEDAACERIKGNRALRAQFELTPQDNVSASAPEARAVGRRVRYFRDGRPLRADQLPLQRAVAENRVIPPMELEVELPGGRRWIAEVIGIPLHDAKARVIGGLAVVADITERKRAEAASRESEQFKQAILDAVTAHVAVLDREGRIVAVNAPWRRFARDNCGENVRFALDAGVGASYLDVCRRASGEAAESARAAREGIEAVLESRAQTFFLEYACHSPELQRWFAMTVTPLGAARGGAVVSHVDITPSRRLTEQLRDERDRFARIAAAVPGVICSFRLRPDLSACFPYISPAIEGLCGLHPEELAESVGPLRAMAHSDDIGHIDETVLASARAMTPWRDEFRLRHPARGEIWVEGHSVPAREPDGSILWIGYAHDVTDRKRAEAALRAALAEKEVLLREVHHRVKNNLAAIVGLMELQREGAAEPATAALLAELSHRVRSMALVHEMLYRSENLSQVDFSGYLRALVAHLHEALDPQSAIRLDVSAAEVWMSLDAAIPCGLIVNELVTNAFKHAFPEPRARSGSDARVIAVAAEQDGARYTLSVADNGRGLPDDLDWATTRTLGLRLVRMLGQHQLRGRLELAGAGGTRFTLRFGVQPERGANPV